MNVAIIKYNAGNIQSVLFALERAGVQAIVTDEAGLIQSADKVIFPGVGEASSAMHYLRERKLDQLILSLKQPVLGICLGMQLLCSYSEENNTSCLNVFQQATVRKFRPADSGLKVPQVGWNTVYNLRSGLFERITENTHCYFVHGYYAGESPDTIALADYGGAYSAALQKNNFYGVQFHPEKSAEAGQKIIQNFLKL